MSIPSEVDERPTRDKVTLRHQFKGQINFLVTIVNNSESVDSTRDDCCSLNFNEIFFTTRKWLKMPQGSNFQTVEVTRGYHHGSQLMSSSILFYLFIYFSKITTNQTEKEIQECGTELERFLAAAILLLWIRVSIGTATFPGIWPPPITERVSMYHVTGSANRNAPHDPFLTCFETFYGDFSWLSIFNDYSAIFGDARQDSSLWSISRKRWRYGSSDIYWCSSSSSVLFYGTRYKDMVTCRSCSHCHW